MTVDNPRRRAHSTRNGTTSPPQKGPSEGPPPTEPDVYEVPVLSEDNYPLSSGPFECDRSLYFQHHVPGNLIAKPNSPRAVQHLATDIISKRSQTESKRFRTIVRAAASVSHMRGDLMWTDLLSSQHRHKVRCAIGIIKERAGGLIPSGVNDWILIEFLRREVKRIRSRRKYIEKVRVKTESDRETNVASNATSPAGGIGQGRSSATSSRTSKRQTRWKALNASDVESLDSFDEDDEDMSDESSASLEVPTSPSPPEQHPKRTESKRAREASIRSILNKKAKLNHYKDEEDAHKLFKHTRRDSIRKRAPSPSPSISEETSVSVNEETPKDHGNDDDDNTPGTVACPEALAKPLDKPDSDPSDDLSSDSEMASNVSYTDPYTVTQVHACTQTRVLTKHVATQTPLEGICTTDTLKRHERRLASPVLAPSSPFPIYQTHPYFDTNTYHHSHISWAASQGQSYSTQPFARSAHHGSGDEVKIERERGILQQQQQHYQQQQQQQAQDSKLQLDPERDAHSFGGSSSQGSVPYRSRVCPSVIIALD